MIKKFAKRFYYALKGLSYATWFDFSFRWQVLGGLIFLPTFIYFSWPLSTIEMLFIFLGWFLILITEMQNTAFETALDRIHPDHHSDIGISKDMAAASVLLAGIFLLGVCVVIILN